MKRAARLRRPASFRLGALACVVLLALAGGLVTYSAGLLEGLERETLKARFDVRGAETPDDVIVVAIDAETFETLREQWPFRRSLHARAIRRLHAAGARAIVYDVQFTEPTVPRQDMALYSAIEDAGGAVLATSEIGPGGTTNVLGGDENLAQIGAVAAASDLHNDSSGAITHFPRQVAGLETLAVATAKRVGAGPLPAAGFEDEGARIDYRGPPGTIPTVPFSDVIRNRFIKDVFRDRIVVVGASAPTLRDVHSTPVGGDELMAGAEVQANAIWTALHGLPLRSAPPALAYLLIALLALASPLVGLRYSAVAAGVAAPVMAVLLLIGAQVAFEAGLVVEVMPPLVAAALGGAGTIAWSQLAESRARRAVTRDKQRLEARVRERTRELWETQLEVVGRLGVAVEWRDAETGLHIDRIGRFCERLALDVGMDPEDAELLRHASALHDLGKVGIPDRILTKPGRLDPEEWALMKTHTTIGASILAGSSSRLVRLAETIALTHHEHWNGGGYPRGLRGEEIPLVGRICAICDVFDALLSPRPYKDPWPIDDVLHEIRRLSGTQFEPRLVDAFLPIALELHEEWFPRKDSPPRAA